MYVLNVFIIEVYKKISLDLQYLKNKHIIAHSVSFWLRQHPIYSTKSFQGVLTYFNFMLIDDNFFFYFASRDDTVNILVFFIIVNLWYITAFIEQILCIEKETNIVG